LMILLDASGSMGARLIDNVKRKQTVAECTKALVEILDEVRELEGLNVDYDIACFTRHYNLLSKENWVNEYYQHDGGTNIINAFSKAQDHILRDQEIDGKKMIIMFTDGDVQASEIREMKDRIVKYGAEVRCMIIGVGADVNSALVKEACGDNNILVRELADIILMEAIATMME